MAGFVDNQTGSPVFERIRESAKQLSRFGMKYEDMVLKNSMAVGSTEAAFLNKNKSNILDENFLYSLAKQDTTVRQYISYFDKDYKGKRDYLRKFSLNPEIEQVLDTVCDEAINYDPSNFFAYPDFLDLTTINEKMREKLYENYKKIYDMWGFADDITAWQYFRQFLVDGFLAFEIIYDDKGKNVIGFKELDPITLIPSVEKQPDGTLLNIWVQFPDDSRRKRTLYDSQIIYISYAKGNSISRLSYTERLIRPYNTLRIIEYTRIIWSVMNSSYKMKMTVPVGSRSPQKAMQTLGELMSIYKEDIRLNDDTGELLVDGGPKIQFYKNYLIPQGQNGQPQIDPLKADGPDLNDTAPLAYFYDKFIEESKVPATRFKGLDGSSTSSYANSADGLDKEEIRFSKFISRLRSIFQEIIVKPLWLQTCKDFKSLEDDFSFKSQLGLKYVSDNSFKINQEIEMITKKKEAVDALAAIMGDGEKPYFSMPYLIENFLGLSDADIKANLAAKKKKEKEAKKEGEEKGGEAEGEITL
jgi:hypothetical protein